MYEHPVYCLASQVMDLTIREYLPSSSTSPCLFSCPSSSLSAPHLTFLHSNPLTNNILSLFLLAFIKKKKPALLVWLSRASNIQPVSPLSSSSHVCLELPALSRLAFFWFLLLSCAFPVCCDLNAFLLLLLFDFLPSHLSHVTSFSTEVRYCMNPAYWGTELGELKDLGVFLSFFFFFNDCRVCLSFQTMTTVVFCFLF